MVNDLETLQSLFDDFEPFEGFIPPGLLVDFSGQLTNVAFRSMWGTDQDQVGRYEKTSRPEVSWGEGYFEAVDWVLTAREARDRYTMITLGACYGSQAVGNYLTLQKINPMPAKMVLVEADPENVEWTKQHLAINNIDWRDCWLVQTAIGDNNNPVLFPVGSPGSGAQNCFATNNADSRRFYAQEILKRDDRDEILQSIILNNNTTMNRDLVPGYDFRGEIKYLSAVTLYDVLAPFDFVDYLECDIQQSEIVVFPPYMDLVRRKARRVHIGTHGKPVHDELVRLFKRDNWDIVFDYAPDTEYVTPYGTFKTSDGILTARNPDL